MTTEDPIFDRTVDHWYVPYLEAAIDYAAIGNAFWLCGDGRLGRVPDPAGVGDRIMIFFGGTVPILLRPSASDYVDLGEAYVDGMMDGQAFREPDVQIKPITLVQHPGLQTTKSTSPHANTLSCGLLTLTISASVSASTSVSSSQNPTVRSPLPNPSAPHRSCPSVPSPDLWSAARLSA